MTDSYRANYALLTFQEHLGTDADALDVPWAEFVGDTSSAKEFVVPAAETRDPYVELQAYDVDEYGHDITLNGTSLTGFDIPPETGWQHWMDAVTGAALREGENTLRIHRDGGTTDEFVVGTATVHWREPVEESTTSLLVGQSLLPGCRGERCDTHCRADDRRDARPQLRRTDLRGR